MNTKPAAYYDEAPASTIIGPQIGPIFDPCGVKITIAFPDIPTLETLTCVLTSRHDAREHREKNIATSEIFKDFVFSFTHLKPGVEYTYAFYDASNAPLDLGNLTAEDCKFLAPVFNRNDRFVLFSCNNIFYSGGPQTKRYRMWSRLKRELEQNRDIKLVIQGGDQVYHDDIETSCLKALRENPEDLDTVRKMMIRNYQHFYGHHISRKILAQIPSVAMWDDHDITDGWGGRPESFDKEGNLKPEWKTYFECAREAFQAYQGAKNPDYRPYAHSQTSMLDFGHNRIVLMDLRSEKNIKDDEAPLISDEHAEAIFRVIRETPKTARSCFVLSPVVPVRISPEKEQTLGGIASLMYAIREFATQKLRGHHQKPRLWRFLFWLSNIGGVADLWDDLTDGLSCKENIPFLRNLISAMISIQSRLGANTIFLSGDIHTGGISEIFAQTNDNTLYAIPQIVSSPIGYEPMAAVVQSQTSEGKDFEIAPTVGGVGGIRARNIFYRSDRNFVIICPDKLAERTGVQFFFEGLHMPITSAAYFSDLPTIRTNTQAQAEQEAASA